MKHLVIVSLLALAATGAVKYRTAAGRLAGYDAPTRDLALQLASGRVIYHVAEDARLWVGRRRLPIEQLGRYLGAQVTIAYVETGGRRVTHTVRIAAGEGATHGR